MQRSGRLLVYVLAALALVAAYMAHQSIVGRRLAAQSAAGMASVAVRESPGLIVSTTVTDYRALVSEALQGQTRLLVANLRRELQMLQVIERKVLGMSSRAIVQVSYTAEYAIGFDLAADAYSVGVSDGRIEIVLAAPMLVAPPAVQDLRHRVLKSGFLIDEKSAAIKLFKRASADAAGKGAEIVADPAIRALCEKTVVDFVRNLLARAPGSAGELQVAIRYRDGPIR